MTSDRRQFMRGEWLKGLAREPVPPGSVEIASMVVHVRPERLARVAADIGAIPQAEIAATDPRGKIVVTVEAGPGDRLGDLLMDLTAMPGVISAMLVYHAIAEGALANAAFSWELA